MSTQIKQHNKRSRRGLVALGWVVGVLALVVVGWLASPLFYDREVSEAFPSTAPAAQVPAPIAAAPTTQPRASAVPMQAEAQPQGQDAAMQAEAQPQGQDAAMQAEAQPLESQATAPAEPVALVRGSFTQVDALHGAEGTATIYRLPDGRHVLRFENFRSLNGPDLIVHLSGNPAPRSSDELHAQGNFEIAPLKGNVGDQNYELPADLDLTRFKSAVIYCRAFRVIFSTAELQFLG